MIASCRCGAGCCAQFPQSNIDAVMARVKAALEPQRAELDFDCGLESVSVPFDEFCGLMRRLLAAAPPGAHPFTAHDLVTLARYYQQRADAGLTLNQMLAICHDQLKRANFDDFDHIEYQCQHHDGLRSVWRYSGRQLLFSVLYA